MRVGPASIRMPAPTIRLRLTLLYGLVFLVTGAVLLTIGYELVRHNLNGLHGNGATATSCIASGLAPALFRSPARVRSGLGRRADRRGDSAPSCAPMRCTGC